MLNKKSCLLLAALLPSKLLKSENVDTVDTQVICSASSSKLTEKTENYIQHQNAKIFVKL